MIATVRRVTSLTTGTFKYQTALLLVTGIILASIVGLLLSFAHQDRGAQQDLRYARIYSAIITEMRQFYLTEVIETLKGTDIAVRHDDHNRPNSLPIPTTMATEFSAYLNSRLPDVNFALVSNYPFPWQTGRTLTDFEKRALSALTDTGATEYSETFDQNGVDVLHYATPVVMQQECIACHNSRPDSPKIDWKVGDVRGIQVVELPLTGAFGLGLSEILLLSFITASGFASIITLLVLNKRSTSANDQLVRKNIELEAETARANQASVAKSQFLSNMSHEIRTPLNGILGTLQLFDDGSLTRGNKESLDIVRQSSRSLMEIVNSILDISKIEANEAIVSRRRFTLRTFLADIVSQHSGLIAEKGIDFLVRVDDTLPVEITSDSLRLEQILNNLLSNALKFTNRGAVTLEVRKCADPSRGSSAADAIELIVSDTGIGIGRDDLPRLFQPFSQLDGSLTRRHMGTGLGLSIVRKLANQLDGEVNIDSAIGVGTTMTVVIPHAFDAQSLTPAHTGTTSQPADPEIVMLGDYATIFRASLLLTQLGKRLRVIGSPEKARELLVSLPDTVRAIVVDRRFDGDAILWLSKIGQDGRFESRLPIIIINDTKTYPKVRSNYQLFEVDGRFSRSNFLEVLREAAPTIGLGYLGSKMQPTEDTDNQQAPLGALRILVVDDNSINRRVLVRLLNNMGLSRVEAVPSAAEAFEILSAKAFDVVFMDLQMPDIDGYMATRLIRKMGFKHLKLFACSAHAFEADVQRSLDEGLDGHISKPVDGNELLSLLKSVLPAT